jgi:hypothetical protein
VKPLLNQLRAWLTPEPPRPAERPLAVAHAAEQTPLRPRVLVAVYDPVLPSRGGRRLTEVCGFHEPDALVRAYVDDLAECSAGYLQYAVVEHVVLDELPPKEDGFRYTGETWLQCWQRRGGWHEPDAADYPALLADLAAARLVAAGEIDEVWCFAPPYAGFYESRMVGAGACWCNAPPLDLAGAARRCIVMGFNYERGVGEMLESFGHRVESLLARAFGSWREWGGGAGHAWDAFSAHEAVAPGRAGCGNVHFAPNSAGDYDWGNHRRVWSSCDDWLAYPHLTGQRRLVDCREWGGGDIRAHHHWWLAHLPRAAGRVDGRLANWWTYAVDPHAIDWPTD